MWKPNEFFSKPLNIQTTIEHLSTKFKELENSYYGFLRKAHKENEKIMKQDSNLGSEFFHNLLREQEKLEQSLKQLNSLKESYNDEISRLRSLLLESNKQSREEDRYDSVHELRALTQSNISKIKEKLFSIDEIHKLDRTLSKRISAIFEDVQSEANLTFANLGKISGSNLTQIEFIQLDTVHSLGNTSVKRIEELCRSNETILEPLGATIEASKKKILHSFSEADTLAVAYTKESQMLKEYFEQARAHVSSILRDTKAESKLVSPTRERISTSGQETNQRIRKSANMLDQLLSECVQSDSKKNRLFTSIKEEYDGACNKVRHYLKDMAGAHEQLRINSQTILNNARDDTRREDRITRSSSNFFESKANQQSQVRMKTYLDKITPFHTQNNMENLSPVRHSSPRSRSASPLQRDRGSEYRKNIVSSKENNGDLRNIDVDHRLSQAKTDVEEIKKEFDNFMISMNQKISYLKMSVRNFIISSGKIVRFISGKSAEEEFALKVYENDKKVLETHLSALAEVTLKLKDPKSPKGNAHLRSQSQDVAKREKSPASKKTITGTNFYIEDSAAPREEPVRDEPGNRIRQMIDDFEKTHNDMLNMNQGGLKRRQESTNDFHAGEKPEIFDHMKNDIKTLRQELAALKIKYEKLSADKSRLKEENANLQQKVKAKAAADNLVNKVKELTEETERLTKENIKWSKTAKKLELKAEERKKNLKQLFELLQEKEKELAYYKNNVGGQLNSYTERMEEIIKEKQIELETQYKTLELQLKEKDSELNRLNELLAKTSYKPQYDEEVTSTMRKDEKLDVLTEQVIEYDKKRQQLEGMLTSMKGISPSKVQEIKDMISFLNREKETTMEKIRNIKAANEPKAPESKDLPTSKSSQQLSSLRSAQNDRDYYKELVNKQELMIEQLKIEQRQLEEKYAELTEDMNTATDHRKRMERNYQDNINLLNKKIQEQNLYIEELEASKKNQRGRDSSRDKGTPIKEPESAYKELITRASAQLDALDSKLDEIFDFVSSGKDSYRGLEIQQKAEKLLTYIKQRELERRREEVLGTPRRSQNNNPSPSPRTVTNEQAEILKKQNSDLEVLLNNYKNEIKQLQRDKEDLENELLLKENEVKKARLEVQAKTLTTEEHIKQLKTLEVSKNKIQVELDTIFSKLSAIAIKFELVKEEDVTGSYQILEKIEANLKEHKLQNTPKKPAQDPEVQKLRTEIKDKEWAHKEKIRELEGINSVLQSEIEDLKRDQENKEQAIQELNEKITDVISGHHSSSQEVEGLRDQIQNLQVKLNEQTSLLTTERKSRKEDASTFQGKMESLNKENRDLIEKVELLSSTIQELERRLEEQENEYKSEIKKVQQAKDADLSGKLAEKEQALAESRKEQARIIGEMNNTFWKETEKYKQKIEQLNQQINQLKNECTEIDGKYNSLTEEIESKQHELLETKKANTELTHNMKKLEETLKTKSREYDTLKTELETMKSTVSSSFNDNEKKIQQLSQEKKKLQDQLSDIGQELADEKAKGSELKKANASLAAKLEQINHGLGELQASTEKKDQQIKQLNQRVKTLETEISQLENQLNEATHKLEAAESTLVKYKASLGEKDKIIARLNQEKNKVEEEKYEIENKYQSEVKTASNKKSVLQHEIEELQKQNESFLKQVDEYKDDKERLEDALNEAEARYNNKQAELDNFIEKNNKVLATLEKNIAEKDRRITELNQEIENLQHQVENYTEANQRLKQDLDQSLKLNSKLTSEKEALTTERALVSKKSSDALEEISNKISEYESKLLNASTQVRGLEDQLNEAKRESDYLKQQGETKEKKLAEVNNALSALEEKYNNDSEAWSNKNKEFAKTVSQLEETLKSRTNEINALNSKLNDAKENIQALETSIRDLNTKTHNMTEQHEDQISALQQESLDREKKLKEKISDHENQKNEYEKEKLALTSQISNLESQCNRLREDIEKAQNALKEQREDSHREYSELSNEYSAYKKEKEQLIHSKESEIQDLRGQLHERDAEIENLKVGGDKKVIEIQQELNTKQEELRKLHQEHEELSQRLTNTIRERDNEINRLNEEISNIKSQLIDRETEIEHLKLGGDERVNKLQEDLNKRADDIKKLNQELENSHARHNKLQTAHTELQELYEQSEEQRNTMAKQLERFNNLDDYEELLSKHNHLQDSHRALEAQRNSLAKQLEPLSDLQERYNQLRHDYNVLDSDYQAYKDEVAKAQSEKKEEPKAKEEKEPEADTKSQEIIEDLKSQNNELLVAINSLSTGNQQLSNKNKDFEAEVFALKTTIKQLKDEIEFLKDENKRITEGNVALTQEVTVYKNEVNQLQTKSLKVQRENDSLGRQVDELMNEKRTLNAKIEEIRKESDKKLSKNEENTKLLARIDEYKAQVTKLSNENESIKTQIEDLKEDNEELRKNKMFLQEQIVSLSNNTAKARQDSEKKSRSELDRLRDSIRSVTETKTYIDLGLTIPNNAEIEDIVKVIMKGINANEKEIESLKTALSEAQSTKNTESFKSLEGKEGRLFEELTQRLIKVSSELEAIVKEALPDLNIQRTEINQKGELTQVEKKIYNNLASLRDLIRGLMNKSGKLEETLQKKENEVEELRQSISKERERLTDYKEISFNVADIDEVKVKSFLDDSYKVDRKSETSEIEKDEEYIRGLRDQVRSYQDECQKLDDMNKQIASDLNVMQFKNEQLQSEIEDLTDMNHKMTTQLAALKKEYSDLQKQQLDQVAKEVKAHLRQTFVKFMESVAINGPDAKMLLDILLSLFDMTENEKKEHLNLLKTKAKKGVFGTLFGK